MFSFQNTVLTEKCKMFSFQVSCFRGYQRLHTSFVDCVTPDVIPHGFPSLMALQESKKTQVTMTWICQVATFADHARLLYRFIILWDCYNSSKAGANCKKKKKKKFCQLDGKVATYLLAMLGCYTDTMCYHFKVLLQLIQRLVPVEEICWRLAGFSTSKCHITVKPLI